MNSTTFRSIQMPRGVIETRNAIEMREDRSPKLCGVIETRSPIEQSIANQQCRPIEPSAANQQLTANQLRAKSKFFGRAAMTAAAIATAFTLAACTGAPHPANDTTAPASDAVQTSGADLNQSGAVQSGTAISSSGAANPSAASNSGAVQSGGAVQSSAVQSSAVQSGAVQSSGAVSSNGADLNQSGAVQSGATVSSSGADLNKADLNQSGADSIHTAQTSQTNSVPPDPYRDFPALAARVFAHADSLYKANLTDSASAYLENFRVIKPLWSTWEAKADSMLNEFGKTRAEKAKAFEPLVLTIQNMNSVKAAYSLVSEAIDSLIAKAPGDSLVMWASAQKQLAYTNTLSKAQKEFAQIKDFANNQAKFAEALKKAEEFQMRYGEFAESLQVKSFMDSIRNTMESADSAAIKYWDSHDPAEALKKAHELIEKSKFADAKEILNKLKVSVLRKEAMEEYNKLAEAFCNAERKNTSQIFAKAQKQKDAAKKKKLLGDAIEPLNRCIQEYPEYSNIQKVLDNKTFLEKELER